MTFRLTASRWRKELKDLTGDKNAEIINWQHKRDTGGEEVYEIDVR